MIALATAALIACAGPAALCERGGPDALALIADRSVATVVSDPGDDPAVTRAATALRDDLGRLGGAAATRSSRHAVIIGTLGRNPTIDRLVRERRIDTSALAGRWEGFLQQVVDRPAPDIDRALVIVGADRRGAAFGAYDIARRSGVSPWAWWADVPVPTRERLMVLPGARLDAPKVKYRGIFLNDEDPALKGWAEARFGGLNHRFYERVFDLVLRLRGNMIWPAMWGKSLWEDDPESAALADRMGIVLGTSHHEPMLRAHVDWERHGEGPWDYARNAPVLQRFWRDGLVRSAGRETLVTIGMRGDGDEPMTKGTAIPLLENIVADQRRIIAEVTGGPADATPQVWALYKEVQDYYDAGMRVPGDVTLLFSDDNWGNIRRLPTPGEQRPGGFGVYYHFDYVGGPRNYKWLNVTQIGRVWEQMSLARAHGADRLWIANVGDLKPMELPISFFLDLAWNPEGWGPDAGTGYPRAWAAEQFGTAEAASIAEIIDRTTRYAARRKPELLDADSWSLDLDDVSARVAADYDALERDALAAEARLPAASRDAYFQLVLHPVLALANLERLYRSVALNRRYAAQGRREAAAMADAAERFFAEDAAIRARYEGSAGGKWLMMMAQTHIGYTGWQQPPTDRMPVVVRPAPVTDDGIGVAVDGDATAWVAGRPSPARLSFDRFGRQTRRVEVFPRGPAPLAFTALAGAPWLQVARDGGTLTLSIDWRQAPAGKAETRLTIAGAGARLEVPIIAVNRPEPPKGVGFLEGDGVIAIEAVDARETAATNGDGSGWPASAAPARR